MSHSKIVSRFAPPRAHPDTVPRDALLARLAGQQHCRLVLLNAGAGYGKTTLLMQWRQALLREGKGVAWLSARPGSDTPRQFCASLAGSLRHAELPLAAGLEQLLAAQETDIGAALVPLLVNAVAACDSTVLLLIDDFHHFGSPEVTGIVQGLIDEAPHNFHLALSTRVMPGLELARLRALDGLVEFDASALAFNTAETAAFLKARLGPVLGHALARATHDCTEGWPAGLQCFATEARHADSAHLQRPHRLLRASIPLAAYFGEDVTGTLPSTQRAPLALLEALSILPRFDAAMAVAVTGDAQAQAQLESALAHNLFLLPEQTPDGRCWLRLHPLFAAFLGQRLQASGRELAPLHHAAAQYFERAGQLPEALQQAILGGDIDAVVRLLRHEQAGWSDFTAVRHLRHWLRDLPYDALARHPDVLVRVAWACVLIPLPRQAARCLDAVDPRHLPASWAADLPLLRGVIAMQHDDATACNAALPSEPQPGWSEIQRQVHASLTIACLARSGCIDAARAHYHAVDTQAALAAQRGLSYAVTMAAARVEWLAGRTMEAQRLATSVLSGIPRRMQAASPAAAYACVLLAEVLCEHELDDAAQSVLDDAERLVRVTQPSNRIGAALARARLHAGADGIGTALERLACAEAGFRRERMLRAAAYLVAEQVRLLAITGALHQAECKGLALDTLAASLRAGDADPMADAERDEIALLAALSGARLALASQRPDDALARCDIAARLAKRLGRAPLGMKADLLRAVALSANGRIAAALELARGVITAGREMRLLRSLREEGPAWCALLAALSCPDDLALESYRIRLATQPALPRAPWPPNAPTATLAGKPANGAPAQRRTGADMSALTPRERQIMDLVEQGLPNKRIAQVLGLSLDTIKWNLKNIFGKLRVSTRYEAIMVIQQQRQEA
ncbi:LuxR C-terminal-related transcriptional regulator [Cupriavidus numazuensis]|uniref:HTH-type transcriptional regulator MalT n=1 Tax=Cupriavidus numazuensis TaxID=221992 RepID=A0ABM8TSG7_9BURK|nr:LuxR C-terminal-related transcriptional regulator [Cupriavidus numazuensis]CAG2159284.1 HTH-type transcriptional regulator MalT [Cupriavidus numazuensis]